MFAHTYLFVDLSPSLFVQFLYSCLFVFLSCLKTLYHKCDKLSAAETEQIVFFFIVPVLFCASVVSVFPFFSSSSSCFFFTHYYGLHAIALSYAKCYHYFLFICSCRAHTRPQ